MRLSFTKNTALLVGFFGELLCCMADIREEILILEVIQFYELARVCSSSLFLELPHKLCGGCIATSGSENEENRKIRTNTLHVYIF